MAKKKPKPAKRKQKATVNKSNKKLTDARNVAAKKEAILKAFEDNTTRAFTFACQAAGVDRCYAYRMRVQDKEFDAAVTAAIKLNKSCIMDGVETKIYELMFDKKNPCKKTLRWYADRHGRDRGYVTRTENVNLNHTGFTPADLDKIDADEAEAAYAAFIKTFP